MNTACRVRGAACSVLVMLLGGAGATAQQTRTVAPNPEYSAGALHRLLFGDHHRDLWTTPIRVPVLDLSTFAGGLTPLQRGGGFQTKSLRLRGGNGRQYQFRSVDKDPSSVLPPELRETLVDRLIQDQTSAGHPTAPLVVAPLLEAVGVLHAAPELVIMPDDARLGEYRAEFAGLLGTIEERPDDPREDVPGFAGADEVVGTDRLLELMEERGDKMDDRAFLRARLVDVFLGDWDRHADQWRWARFGPVGQALWQPIPRDRDQAFVRLDGLLLNLARRTAPQLVSFADDYPPIFNLTWNGRIVDRRFLVGLERPVWDSMAVALQRVLTDEVIAAAVRRLPPEHYALNGEPLAAALRTRRDGLPEIARRFYELLAQDVDVYGSDAREDVDVIRVDDHTVDVTIRRAGATVYRRRFFAAETEEVRLYLQGGADSVAVSGPGGGRLTVRVVAGGGDDTFVDTSRGGVRIYDARGAARVVRGRATHFDDREFVSRNPPVRDWGSRTLPLFMIGGSPDLGVTVGGGLERVSYGFRKQPYSSYTRLNVQYATGAQAVRAQLDAEIHRQNSSIFGAFRLRASGVEILRFHGLGNETELTQSSDFYKVRQAQYSFEPRLVIPLDSTFRVEGGTVVQWSDTDLDDDRFISVVRPYGAGQFGQLGLRAGAAWDLRNRASGATRGVRLSAGYSWFPEVWDVDHAFAEAHGEATAYLSAGAGPTLAVRAGGKRVWGTYPFHEAAYIGDASTVRLGRKQRYGGDGALYGSAEVRQKLARVSLILPGDLGVIGFADRGRVFLDGEDSDVWHNAYGGGIYFAVLRPENALNVTVAKSDERTAVYLGAGFAF